MKGDIQMTIRNTKKKKLTIPNHHRNANHKHELSPHPGKNGCHQKAKGQETSADDDMV
jgi:hypothetical protein